MSEPTAASYQAAIARNAIARNAIAIAIARAAGPTEVKP